MIKQMEDTSNLLQWFNQHKDVIQPEYNQRIKATLTVSERIKQSIAYHIVNEQAMKDGYSLTDCQINKLALLIVMEE